MPRRSRRRGSSRRRGTGTIEQEEKEMAMVRAEKKEHCQKLCVAGTDVFAKAKYQSCLQECDDKQYTKQDVCGSQIQRCSFNTEDGRKCYPEKVNNFLFFPDTDVVEESRFAIPQLYKKRFNKPLIGCEDLMTQHETYLANKRTGPYVIGKLNDCQMRKFIEQERETHPGVDIDKTLRSIMCRKSNY